MKIKYLLLVVAAISLFISCEKEEDADKSGNPFRIKQLITEKDGLDNYRKYDFTYEGEKLVKILEYKKDENQNWMEYLKTEIIYSGEAATETFFHKESSGWVAGDKSVSVIFEGLICNKYYYVFKPEDSTWVQQYTYTYNYSGKNITSWLCEANNGEGLVEVSKGEYKYQNNKLAQYINYEHQGSANWYQVYKELFTYDGNKLDYWTGYRLDESNNWVNYIKADLSYSDNKVSSIERFNWVSAENLWESEDKDSYTYYSNGCLELIMCRKRAITKIEYEAGAGNTAFFWTYPENYFNGNPTFRF